MGLFTRNFDKPGPGVSPDAPRKKGAARFFEILGRDFSTIWLAGILAMLGGLPFAAGVWFAVETHSLVPLVIAGVLGGMIAAPQIVGLNDTILRTLRDEPGYWWETYRRTWKRNLKESLLPGAVCGLLLAMELFSLCHINIAGGSVGLSKDSVILLEQIRTIDKRRLREHMGRLDEQQMSMVDNAIAVSFGLHGSGTL